MEVNMLATVTQWITRSSACLAAWVLLAGCTVAPYATPPPPATPELAPGLSAPPAAAPSPSGTTPATAVPPTAGPSPTWSGPLQWPAGTVALYGVAERIGAQEALELYALDAAGSAINLGVRVTAGARLSDDGRWIVYLDAPPPAAGAVVVRNLQSGAAHTVPLSLAAGEGPAGQWAFDRDGSRLAFLEVATPGKGKCAAWSITVVQLAGGWSARFERAGECSLLPGIPLGWSSSGDLLLDVFRPYAERWWANVWALALPPGHPARPIESLGHRQLLAPEAQGWGARLSPDGTRLLYLARDPGYTPAGLEGASPDMAVNQLWTLDVSSPGGQPTRLFEVTDGGALARVAAWAPGGDAILCVQGRYPPGSGTQSAGPLLGGAMLKVADLTGAVRTVGPLPEEGHLIALDWCAPSTALATFTRGTRQALYAVDVATGQATRVAEAPQLAVLGRLPADARTLPNPEPSRPAVSSWPTYEDTEQGYRLHYPAGATIATDQSGQTTFTLTDNQTTYTMRVGKREAPVGTDGRVIRPASFLATISQNPGIFDMSEIQEFTINGVPAALVAYSYSDPKQEPCSTQRAQQAHLIGGEQLYMLTCTVAGPDQCDAAAVPWFGQMLHSFETY
ncbi:MAG TPA: hypothetical protein PLG21_16330 [Anaerolineae bacterium]|nr:hypothetical protein [Anaerolineae bacterium]HPL29613.1 hypothetical protein [Anaerolineae bacterium]